MRLVPATVTGRGAAATGPPELTALLAPLLQEISDGAPVLTIGRAGGRAPHVVCDAVELELAAGARALPFPDEAFGSVISLDVVESADDAPLAAEQVRVCRPGGLVVIGGRRRDILRGLDVADLRERDLWPEAGRRTRGWSARILPAERDALVALVARKRAADGVAAARLRYRRAAAGYDRRYRGTAGLYFGALEDRYVHSLLGDIGGRTVLDVGTGTGRFAIALASRAELVVGIDVSPEMLREARTRGHDGARLALMDGTRTAFREGVFDAALCIGAFEGMADLGPAFREVARLLKPGGRFVFTSFNVHRLRPFGAYPLGPDTRDHSLLALEAALGGAGLRLVRFHGTFFLSPGFVWRYHGALRWSALRRPYIAAVVAVNRLLDAAAVTRRRCGQFVVLAERRPATAS